ncbi:TSC22 domain family protein 1-like isoform X2 [Sceloporus undulatus]|uniref:TSC22 domain family protein 1-like isoform X2 n=1 Tax=Sceloporus undulatus TaxID=8520 RepID=UPI001C4CD2AC|nr:TSC22 domain family protein 1-like isoform X2 [Sceloporus undulatus]
MHHHHQPDSAADTGGRKMAHPAMLPRRGSSSSSSSAANTTNTVAASLEDYPPSLLAQPPPLTAAAVAAAAAASSPALPGPQAPPLLPPPPQSLALLSQPPPQLQPQPPPGLAQAGSQMKKKSGFQITSVTPAQISASLSSNNSIAEDTESYDDLDESHTEDLSSSEILDVSLSRATDLGEPERSSSEETLNNFQEAESPGAVSPNQPHLPQQQQQQQHPQQSMVINGSVHPPHGHHYHHHHHHHHHHGHHHAAHSAVGGPAAPGGPPSSPSFRKLSTTGSMDGAAAAAVPVCAASSTGTPGAAVVSHFRGPGPAGATSASGATTGTFSSSVGPTMASSMPSHVNRGLSNILSTGGGAALSGASGSVNVAVLSGVSNGTSTTSGALGNSSNPVAGAAMGATSSHLQPAASTSRFRVVKLDSSSEPFKKGRWTCTEFYDKENPASLAEGVASVNKAVDTLKQNPLEVTSERESTSGSSVSSNVSTLSHYTESVGSGEMGAPTVVVQQQAFQGAVSQQLDFSNSGPQAVSAPSIPQSISQSQLAQVQLHPQDVNYPQQQPGVQPPVSAVPPPVNIVGGHQQPSIAPQQQLPYTQSSQPVQAVPVVPQQQQLSYGQGQAQHPTPPQQMPVQMASGHVQPVNQNSVTGPVPDYMQQQQQQQQQQQSMGQTPASMQTGPTMVGTGAPIAQAPSVQPSVQAHLGVTSSQPVAHAQTTMPTIGSSAQMMNVGQQANIPTVVQQPPVTNQINPPVMAQNAAPPPSQAVPPVPAGIIHSGQQGSTSGLAQPLVIAPQSTLLPVQAGESLVQGLAGQQLPPVSPVPSVSAVPAPCHSAANVPPAAMSLAPSKNIAQSSGGQNGNLVQNVSQPSLVPTSINLPVAQNVSPQIPLNSAQFSAQSLAQAVLSRAEDARRSTDPTLGGLSQPTSGESGGGASSSLSSISDVGSSMASSLFPLKVLPLTAQLVDGEDERALRMKGTNWE